MYFIKFGIYLSLPFMIWGFLMLVYLVFIFAKTKSLKITKVIRRNAVVLFLIIGFMMQPNILQNCLEMFRCEKFRDPNPLYFMIDSPNTRCWTHEHLIWSLGVALPMFALWGFILPFIALRKLKRSAKNLKDIEIYARYSFLYEGLKRDRYYWYIILCSWFIFKGIRHSYQKDPGHYGICLSKYCVSPSSGMLLVKKIWKIIGVCYFHHFTNVLDRAGCSQALSRWEAEPVGDVIPDYVKYYDLCWNVQFIW